MARSPFAAAYRLPARVSGTDVAEHRPIFDPPRVFNRGLLTAWGIVLPVDSRIVAGWLPQPARLGAQEVTPPRTHPVVILVGHQQRVHLNLLPRLRLDYREWVVMVPYTRLGGGRDDYLGPFMCPIAHHLDRVVPTWLGRFVLATPKDTARFEIETGMTRLYGRDGRFLGELASREAQRHRERVSMIARKRLVDVLQQPNVCCRGPGQCRFFGADWGIYDARIHARDATLTVAEGLVPDSSWYVGESSARDFSTSAWERLQRDGAGLAFSLETRWLLGLPEKRSAALRRWRAGRVRG